MLSLDATGATRKADEIGSSSVVTAWALRSVLNESKLERSRRSGRGFLQRAVAEVYDAVAESALVEKLELAAHVGW